MPNTVGIVGSRAYPDLAAVRRYVTALPDGTALVCGGAAPVDKVAVKVARAREMTVECHPPDWERHGDCAGLKRSVDIVAAVNLAHGRLVAFPLRDPKTYEMTNGTAETIAIARREGVHVEVIEAGAVPEATAQRIEGLHAMVVKAATARNDALRAFYRERARRVGIALAEERDTLVAKLDAGWAWSDAHPDDPDGPGHLRRWYRWLKTYEAVCDALRGAQGAA